VLEDSTELDLPIVSDETLSVRQHDVDLVTLISKLDRRGHSTIGVDVEIRRLLRQIFKLLTIQQRSVHKEASDTVAGMTKPIAGSIRQSPEKVVGESGNPAFARQIITN
jgi:hypothetical protein